MEIFNIDDADSYPVDSFPLVARQAIEQIAHNVQAPMPMIASSVLALLATAFQSRLMVRLPNQLKPKPVSLFVMVIAESGERKSAVDKIVFEPIQRLDAELVAKHKADTAIHRAQHQIWDAQRKEMLRQITKKTRTDKGTAWDEQELITHLTKEPNRPKQRQIVHRDPTERAFVEALEGVGEAVAILNDEGETSLKSHLFRKPSYMTKGWDGGVLSMERSQGVSITAIDPKLTIYMMVQPAILEEFQEKARDKVRGSGWWARFLICHPQSTPGTRFENLVKPEWNYVQALHSAVLELMEANAPSTPMVCELDSDAVSFWIYNIGNRIERDMQPLWYLSDVKDFASKAGEITIRLAALFHHLGRQQGPISRDTLIRAWNVVCYYIDEFKKLFSTKYNALQVQQDSQLLFNYLHKNVWQQQWTFAIKNDVRQRGPLRGNRFYAALDALVKLGNVWIEKRTNKRLIINLVPPRFGGAV